MKQRQYCGVNLENLQIELTLARIEKYKKDAEKAELLISERKKRLIKVEDVRKFVVMLKRLLTAIDKKTNADKAIMIVEDAMREIVNFENQYLNASIKHHDNCNGNGNC